MDIKALSYLTLIATENETLETLIDKYYFYSRDLCTYLEESFNVAMFLFLREKGSGALARALAEGSKQEILYDVLDDISIFFKNGAYNELMEYMLDIHQPYIPLYGFMLHIKKPPYRYLSVIEWLDKNVQNSFAEYVKATYNNDLSRILAGVNKWIGRIQKL